MKLSQWRSVVRTESRGSKSFDFSFEVGVVALPPTHNSVGGIKWGFIGSLYATPERVLPVNYCPVWTRR